MRDELREAIASWIGRSGYVRPVGTPPDHDRAWERMKSEADGLLRDPAFRAALGARRDSPTLERLDAINARVNRGLGEGLLAAARWRDALIEVGGMLDDLINDAAEAPERPA